MSYKFGVTMPPCQHLYCPMLACRFPKDEPESYDDADYRQEDDEMRDRFREDEDHRLDDPRHGQTRDINRRHR